MLKRPLILAAACLLFPLVASAELVDNPSYQHWAQYKAGTYVTYKMAMEIPGMPAGMGGQNSTMTYKLAAITPEKATVETTIAMAMPGVPSQTHKQEIPAKIEKEKLDTADFQPQNPQAKDVKVTNVKNGKEKIDVKGESVEAVTREATVEMTQEGETFVAKIKTWISPKVPGGMVKMENNTEKPMTMKNTMTLSDYNIAK